MVQYTLFKTRWGWFGAVARNGRLVATHLPTLRGLLNSWVQSTWENAVEEPDLLPSFQKQVEEYFCGFRRNFRVPVDLSLLPPFRRAVLVACRKIPHGRTASYTDLARVAGSPQAVRAAGGAMAHNPIPLVIPCHRVLRADGSLGGFSSPEGVEQKRRLLLHEGLAMPPCRNKSVRNTARVA